ncbi:TPA_asm: hypothetical protein [Altiarchaeum virus]|nr:MAG: hypothetical protein BWK75_06440 [Candidatus Altiarchaeales archaeon A3]DAZ85550.1 TPA_asm: hypothetical protein [Altiarchaeum virus]
MWLYKWFKAGDWNKNIELLKSRLGFVKIKGEYVKKCIGGEFIHFDIEEGYIRIYAVRRGDIVEVEGIPEYEELLRSNIITKEACCKLI